MNQSSSEPNIQKKEIDYKHHVILSLGKESKMLMPAQWILGSYKILFYLFLSLI